MSRVMWIAGFCLVGMVVACDDGYQHAKMEAEHYNDMVCNGYWPDFEEREPDCSFVEAAQ